MGRIADDGDGTPPRIMDPWAKPEPTTEPERVVVWRTGDSIDKLKPYVGKEGVEVRGEHEGVTVTGPLSLVYNNNKTFGQVELGKAYTLDSALWAIIVTAPKPERVVVWRPGDPIDKLKTYAWREGVEVRAERDGTVVVGPLKDVYADGMRVGGLTITESAWAVTVTAPKAKSSIWWQIEGIEPDHVVSWTDRDGKTYTIVWQGASDLSYWRDRWAKHADPATWRVTDVHAAGGPKQIAGAATTKE